MEDKQVKITSVEYQKQNMPGPGMLLIQKDNISERRGQIVLPRSAIEQSLKWAPTGVIVAMSRFQGEDDFEAYLSRTYKVGDRVGFSSSVPFVAPAPPDYQFENPNRANDGSVMIHIKDVICVICENEEKRAEFSARFK